MVSAGVHAGGFLRRGPAAPPPRPRTAAQPAADAAQASGPLPTPISAPIRGKTSTATSSTQPANADLPPSHRTTGHWRMSRRKRGRAQLACTSTREVPSRPVTKASFLALPSRSPSIEPQSIPAFLCRLATLETGSSGPDHSVCRRGIFPLSAGCQVDRGPQAGNTREGGMGRTLLEPAAHMGSQGGTHQQVSVCS